MISSRSQTSYTAYGVIFKPILKPLSRSIANTLTPSETKRRRLLPVRANYTVSQKKLDPYLFEHNFRKYCQML